MSKHEHGQDGLIDLGEAFLDCLHEASQVEADSTLAGTAEVDDHDHEHDVSHWLWEGNPNG